MNSPKVKISTQTIMEQKILYYAPMTSEFFLQAVEVVFIQWLRTIKAVTTDDRDLLRERFVKEVSVVAEGECVAFVFNTITITPTESGKLL